MDAIIVNGTINTLDAANGLGGRTCPAAAVAGERIIALGEEADIRKLAGAKTEVIDLKGGIAFPGFYDSHNHLAIYSYLLSGLDLSPEAINSLDEIVGLVKDAAAKAAPGEWIKGGRFIDYRLRENRYPTRHDLDPVSPDNPVVLYHSSFHACVLNSRALEEWNITAESRSLVGGLIEKDADGQPTGVLHDADMMVVFSGQYDKDMRAMTAGERAGVIEAGSLNFARSGLTGAADALVTPISLTAYQDALVRDRLKVRVNCMNEVNHSGNLFQTGLRTGFGGDWLKVGPVKIFYDGGMTNRTAAMSEPYLTPPHDKGLKMMTPAAMKDLVAAWHGAGFQIAVHVQGDEAIGDTLDAFENVLGPVSDNPLRHRIEHGGFMFPPLLERAAAMSVPVAVQPAFFSCFGDGYYEAFGDERTDAVYPFRAMLDRGMVLGGGSDCPVVVHDPRLALRDAVIRKSPSGRTVGPGSEITMEEMIRMYTRGSAWMGHEENLIGSLVPGKRADLTVFAADPRTMDPAEVPDLPIRATIIGGRVIHYED